MDLIRQNRLLSAAPLIYFLLLLPPTAPSSSFRRCPDIHSVRTFPRASLPPDYLQADSQVPEDGHFSGIFPYSYRIFLDFEDRKNYLGALKFQFRVKEPTRAIQLNVNFTRLKLDFGTLRLRSKVGAVIMTQCVKEVEMVPELELLTLRLKTTLYPGTYLGHTPLHLLQINFKKVGPEVGDKHGINYADGFNDTWALHTVFQFTAARKAFPCIDHPSVKAPFKLTIRHPTDLQALSTTLPRSYDANGSRAVTKFKWTPPLPSYLVSFALLRNFANVTSILQNGTLVRVFYPNIEDLSAKNFTWILPRTEEVIREMEAFTGLAYPMAKLDFLILHPFMADGLENQGLVSLKYRKMTQPAEIDISTNKDVLVTHEIVHHWIGNYFTISHWDEIVIQEGFTTYIERYINTKHNWTAAKHKRIFIERYRYLLFAEPTAPLDLERVKRSGLWGFFLEAYLRGSSVFQTLEDLFSFESLRLLLQKACRRFKWGTASFKDLIQVMEEDESAELSQTFRDWLSYSGVPVLKLSRNPAHGIVNISKFRYSGKELIPSAFQFMELPLRLSEHNLWNSRKVQRTSLTKKIPDYASQEVSIAGISNDTFLTLNANFTTLSVILYDPKDFLTILEILGTNNERVRKGLLMDFFWGISKNAFPPPESQADFDAWRAIFTSLTETQLKEGRTWLQGVNCCVDGLRTLVGQNVTLSAFCEKELGGILEEMPYRKPSNCSSLFLYQSLSLRWRREMAIEKTAFFAKK